MSVHPIHAVRALLGCADRLWRRLRLIYWNAHPEIHISSRAYISRGAQVCSCHDGQPQRGRVEIAAGTRIATGTVLAPYGGSIVLRKGVYIGPYCVLYGHGGLEIGRNSMIAGHTLIIPSDHRFEQIDRPIRQQGAESRGIKVGEDVWVGAGVRVLDGVTIGRGCIIGAGAVVNRSLPDFAIAVGVPARVIGTRRDQISRPALSLPFQSAGVGSFLRKATTRDTTDLEICATLEAKPSARRNDAASVIRP